MHSLSFPPAKASYFSYMLLLFFTGWISGGIFFGTAGPVEYMTVAAFTVIGTLLPDFKSPISNNWSGIHLMQLPAELILACLVSVKAPESTSFIVMAFVPFSRSPPMLQNLSARFCVKTCLSRINPGASVVASSLNTLPLRLQINVSIQSVRLFIPEILKSKSDAMFAGTNSAHLTGISIFLFFSTSRTFNFFFERKYARLAPAGPQPITAASNILLYISFPFMSLAILFAYIYLVFLTCIYMGFLLIGPCLFLPGPLKIFNIFFISGTFNWVKPSKLPRCASFSFPRS